MNQSRGSEKRQRGWAHILCVILLLALAACTGDTPAGPLRDNPLDPENPQTGGDPYQLSVELGVAGALLNWQEPDFPGITGYNLYRSVNEAEFSLYASPQQTSYLDEALQHGQRYSYYVVALAGEQAPASGVTQISIDTAPVLQIGDGSARSSTRHVQLSVSTYGAQQIRIWEGAPSDSSGAPWREPAATIDWQLATGAGEKVVFAQALFEEGRVSPLASASVQPAAIDPQLELAGGAQFAEARLIPLSFSGRGACEYQLANVRPEELAVLPQPHKKRAKTEGVIQGALSEENDWLPLPAGELTRDWLLERGAGQKQVTLRLRNDFLLEESISASIDPRLPANLGFQILEGDSSSNALVWLDLHAEWADSLRVANESITEMANWLAFSDTLLQWNLVEGSIPANFLPGRPQDPRVSCPEAGDIQQKTRGIRETDEGLYHILVQFKNSFDVPSEILQQEIELEIPSRITIAGGIDTTATRQVSLDLWSQEASEMALDTSLVELQQHPQWQSFQTHVDGFSLAAGAGQKWVYARFRNASGAVSSVYHDSVEAQPMHAGLQINDGDTHTSRRGVLLQAAADGVNLQLRFAENLSALEDSSYRELQSEHAFQLSTGAELKTVYAQFRNDFLAEEIVSASILPANISGSAVFNAAYTNRSQATLFLESTGALEFALALEDSLPWQALQDSLSLALSEEDGWNHLRLWLRNEFYASGHALQDSIARDTHCALDSVTLSEMEDLGIGDTFELQVFLAEDSLGAEGGADLSLRINALHSLQLLPGPVGSYSLDWLLPDSFLGFRDTLRLQVIDRAGNQIEELLSPIRFQQLLLPAGEFDMGDLGAATPEHSVILSQDYFLDRYEISNAQYCAALQWAWEQDFVNCDGSSVQAYGQELLDLDGVCEISFDGQSFTVDAGRESYPVLETSWFGAACFCDWRSLICDTESFYNGVWDQSVSHSPVDAAGYRLPTEAEWEYAAQFDDERVYPWGDDAPSALLLNYANQLGWTAPVGVYPATGLGFYDLAGNLQEWCGDWWAPYSSTPVTDPLGAMTGTLRVIRGGDWFHGEELVRCAARNQLTPASTASYTGFRTARRATVHQELQR